MPGSPPTFFPSRGLPSLSLHVGLGQVAVGHSESFNSATGNHELVYLEKGRLPPWSHNHKTAVMAILRWALAVFWAPRDKSVSVAQAGHRQVGFS